jgi:putative transposase
MQLAPQDLRTFFVTSVTVDRRALLQSERMAGMLVDVLQSCRRRNKLELHEFVVMPDHFHLLITPAPDVSLEKSVQFIKGGFSFRARKELRFGAEIWQRGYAYDRVTSAAHYARLCAYVRGNPVKRFLVEQENLFRYSSAYPDVEIDPAPPWLKPSAA